VATVVGYQIARSSAVSMKVASQGRRGSVVSTCTSGTPVGTIIPSGRALISMGRNPA
jgi:hypothetical protein